MENSAMSIDSSSPYYVDPMNYQMEDFSSFYDSYMHNALSNKEILGYVKGNPDHWLNKFLNFGYDPTQRARDEYNRQKELKDRAFEEAQLSAARRYQEYLESSKYQRTSGDLKAAGYNPWIALQSGLGAANVSAAPSTPRNSSRSLENPSHKGSNAFMNLLSTALRVAAIVAMHG